MLAAIQDLSDEEGGPCPASRGHQAAASSSQPALAAVTAVSDDEGGVADERPPRGSKRKKSGSGPSYHDVRKQLVRALSGSCRCARRRQDGRNCVARFRGRLDDLLALQLRLRQLHKLDMDREARLDLLNLKFVLNPHNPLPAIK